MCCIRVIKLGMTIESIVIPSSNHTYHHHSKPRYDNHLDCHTEVKNTYDIQLLCHTLTLHLHHHIYTHTADYTHTHIIGISSFLVKNLLVTCFQALIACWLLIIQESKPLLRPIFEFFKPFSRFCGLFSRDYCSILNSKFLL